MKTTSITFRLLATAFIFSIGAFVVSCKKDSESISSEGSKTAANESAMASQTDEVDDMATSGLQGNDQASGRTATYSDYRLNCAAVTLTDTTDNHKTSGILTIDFGASPGCTDTKGNTRIGKIIVTWSDGRWWAAGAQYQITFNGYSINGVSFSNKDFRTITNVSTGQSPLTFNVVASHTLTWPDASTATRQVHQTRQWQLSLVAADNNYVISQTSSQTAAASGTNRFGTTYSVAITTPIVYNIACSILNRVFLPVQGVETITYDTNKTLTVDFGTGSCDNNFTLTEDGHTVTSTGDNSSTH
jgi:hypothetical protein